MTVGTTVTCTGDQSAGIAFFGPPVSTLNVNSLTANIAPASGIPGINFGSTGSVTITSNSLMSCRVDNGAYAFIREGQCVWAQGGARFLNRTDTSDSTGFREETAQVSGGAQLAMAPNWRLGFAASYEHSDIKTSSVDHSIGDRASGGAALKHTSGPMLLAVALSGGRGWYDTTRAMSFGGFSATATSNSEVSYLSGKLRAAYLIDRGTWYAKPLVDFNATRLWLGSIAETGAGGANLITGGNENTVLSASPALEFGTQWMLSNDMLLRPFVRAGATFFSNTDFGVSSQFAGTPPGVLGFATTTSIDRVVGDVSVGVDILSANGGNLKLNYDGQFGDTTHQHSFGGRASFRF